MPPEDKHTILVVDDEPRMIQFIRMNLELEGFRVIQAANGLEGGVSRRHARVHQQKSQFFIEDLGSANGTFLNGQRLTPYLPHPLRDGDEVQLGRVRLRINVQ